MRFVGLKRASFESWVIGAAAASVHAVIVVLFILFVARGSRDAQWELGFVPLTLLDLPVAILGYPLGFAVSWAVGALGVHIDPIFVIVAIANGLVGTAFYLIAPPAISAHRRNLREAV